MSSIVLTVASLVLAGIGTVIPDDSPLDQGQNNRGWRLQVAAFPLERPTALWLLLRNPDETAQRVCLADTGVSSIRGGFGGGIGIHACRADSEFRVVLPGETVVYSIEMPSNFVLDSKENVEVGASIVVRSLKEPTERSENVQWRGVGQETLDLFRKLSQRP